MTILTKSAVVLAKVEGTAGVDAVPTPADDAILVGDPNYTIDPNILQRNFVSFDISPQPHKVGRKLAGLSFEAEIRSNGLTNSGVLADAAKLGRLFTGCGMLPAALTAGIAQIGQVIADSDNDASAPAVAWAKGGAPAVTLPVLYAIEVTTGGASATAEVTITNNNPTEDDLSAAVAETVTTAVALDLGGSGATLTPTWAGDLTVGDKWYVLVTPAGIEYKPTTSGQKTLTLYAYFDGLLHKLTGCMGSYQVTADAGDIAKVTFNFTGNYIRVVEAAMPLTPVYEKTQPPLVENSLLTYGVNADLVAAQWTFDMANSVVPRPDVNKPDGYNGVRITSRAPAGGFNPETVLETTHPFWQNLERGKLSYFTTKIGDTPGNIVILDCPQAQPNANSYSDRDGIRSYDHGLLMKRYAGNDEVRWVFC